MRSTLVFRKQMASLPVTPTLNLTPSIPSIHPSSYSNFSNKLKIPICKPLSLNLSKKQSPFIIKATETNNEAENPTTTGEAEQQQSLSSEENSKISELGEEIKKAMKERDNKAEESGGFLSGVFEEIGEIEWPEFGKVVGTTGVVLGVIAGSNVVLLTVNAVLAELSDKVFAGRGFQDFFAG